ncbi:uncharacterized protein LOC129913569 [Episyrphus balteatus]|uniref:uncharacterized protein LOC129913569 n=1 Tax=Episyrphus balteatus TaxID=286459 RepID=UPI002486C88F|nr:uncharacterized protein LOC129913569 [Episyrphus balteatus]
MEFYKKDFLILLYVHRSNQVFKNTRIEDQVQRLSLQGSSAFKIDDKKNISLDEEINCLRLSSTIRTEENSRSPFSRQRKRPPEAGCSSSSSGSCSSSGRTIESLSCNDNGSEMSEDAVGKKKNEPIYAVVDLKNKYEHRARIRHEMEEKRKSLLASGQINDLDEVTTDYEEVFDFQNESFDDTMNTNQHYYDDENIYEPINIPDPSLRDHKHRNVLWKYISRLNIDALFELARNRKKTVKTAAENTSPFANIKQKIGHHRKSLRIRMIKLYARENHQEVPEEIVETINDDDKSDLGQT